MRPKDIPSPKFLPDLTNNARSIIRQEYRKQQKQMLYDNREK